MKIVQFDKVVSLVIDPTETPTKVVVNGLQLYYEDGILKEEIDTLTVKIAKEIEAKYKKQEDGQFSPEDIESIQEEVATYKEKKEVLMLIGESNLSKEVEKLTKMSLNK